MAKQPKSDPFAAFEMVTQRHRARLAALTGERPPGWLDFPDWLPVVSPHMQWEWRWQRFLYDVLGRIHTGELKRVILSVPPRHGKTALVTVRFSAWTLEQWPEHFVILTAHKQKLANKMSREARAIARERIPLSKERWAADEWLTEAGGGLIASGVGGGLPGFGGRLIIIDDPIRDHQEAANPDFRERLWEWYTGSLKTRLEPDGAILVISTRWHEDDLSGRLLEQSKNGGEQWVEINLPALADADDPLGRASGEPLCPDRFSREYLLGVQQEDPYGFAALYQGRPVPRDGALFDVSKIRLISRAELPPALQWCRYWDLAGSTKPNSSFTAAAAIAVDPVNGNLYIRDMIRQRLEWPDLRVVMIDTMRAEPSTANGIEQALHGLAAFQELLREPKILHCPIEKIVVDRDKYSRALPFAQRMKEGRVHFVAGEWVEACKSELAMFPRGKFSDQVDTLSGGLRMCADQTRFEIGHSSESPFDGAGSIW